MAEQILLLSWFHRSRAQTRAESDSEYNVSQNHTCSLTEQGIDMLFLESVIPRDYTLSKRWGHTGKHYEGMILYMPISRHVLPSESWEYLYMDTTPKQLSKLLLTLTTPAQYVWFTQKHLTETSQQTVDKHTANGPFSDLQLACLYLIKETTSSPHHIFPSPESDVPY